MILKKIPMNMYENFHKKFSGSNQNTFNVCSECGGACEHNKIGTLLPGEKEYMAKKMGMSVSEFKLRYLDVLKMDDGTIIHVLKLGELCPFLNRKTEVCECMDFKPLICKIYPVVFTVKKGKVNFTLDNWCQLSKKEVCRNYFKSAIPLLSRLPIPVEWFRYVVSYDDLCFDYEQIKESRKGKNQYAAFTLRELLSFQIDKVARYKIEAYRAERNRVEMYEIKATPSFFDYCQEIEESTF
ncbi:YkgJ family cysteine cluster protein [Methanosarcina hadiensis]|uniref:YkgJ family cysteine cluster protein n=1 Tax=Methanosarcina hadiensis TaxID=3078083 RepID=UPI00397728FF